VACLFSLTYHIKPSFDSTVIRSKAIHSATPTPSIPPFALFASCLTANKDLYQASLRKSRLAGEFLCSLPRRPRRYRPLAGDNLQTILSLSWSLILALECNFRTYIGYIFTFNPPGQFIRIRQVSAAGRTDARLYIYTLNSDQVEEGRLQANFLACVPAFVDISLIKKYLAIFGTTSISKQTSCLSKMGVQKSDRPTKTLVLSSVKMTVLSQRRHSWLAIVSTPNHKDSLGS
jgi:hypothetical protein